MILVLDDYHRKRCDTTVLDEYRIGSYDTSLRRLSDQRPSATPLAVVKILSGFTTEALTPTEVGQGNSVGNSTV